MLPYKVEIFSREFELIAHENVGSVDYFFDYLAPEPNSVTIPDIDLEPKYQYIRISGNGQVFEGVITDTNKDGQPGTQTLLYVPFLYQLLNIPIGIWTYDQGQGTLENYIKDYIYFYFIDNIDPFVNVQGLSTASGSSTSPWGFNLKAEVEGGGFLIANFYETIIARAMTKYSVGVNTAFDFNRKTIRLMIGKVSGTKNIDADLDNIYSSKIIYQKANTDVNMLSVHDLRTGGSIYYYLHPDGTFSPSYEEDGSDRIFPTIYNAVGYIREEGQSTGEAQYAAAASVFNQIEYENLIEITVACDDELVRPLELEYGQILNVYSKGTAYASILTGKRISGGLCTLICGSIRMDLTKKLRRILKK